jgi:hypothetical protein
MAAEIVLVISNDKGSFDHLVSAELDRAGQSRQSAGSLPVHRLRLSEISRNADADL